MLLVGLDPFMGLRCLLPKATKKSWHSKILSLPDDYELGSLILLPSILLVYDLSSRLSLQGSPSQSRDDVLSFDPRFLQPSQLLPTVLESLTFSCQLLTFIFDKGPLGTQYELILHSYQIHKLYLKLRRLCHHQCWCLPTVIKPSF
ncbi:BnaC07g12580D [Brassica napus]|uniref:BnaC07g12580D protein n=3 Tax=Brassica TaxID=3705 RepID=A0A078GPD2_BRANA|nr:BnaC07g12580D [Brassica napus]VDD36932.1 unnamed protein product [Brassica oleracea]